MILNKDKREFVDTFCRLTLLEFIELSTQKENEELKRFVTTEATYNDVLFMILKKYDKNIVFEDIQTDAKIRQVEGQIAPFMGFGLAILGGGLTHGGLGKLAAAGVQVPGGQFGRIAISMLAAAGINWGYDLLSKVIKSKLSKLLDRNKKLCQSRFIKDPLAKEKISICMIDATIAEYRKQIADVQSQLNKCPQTAYPERCQSALLRKIGDFKQSMIKQQNDAVKGRQRLQARMIKQQQSARKLPVNQVAPGKSGTYKGPGPGAQYDRSNIV